MANQLDGWKVLPRPEHLTELYFANLRQLPTTYRPDKPQAIAFTIHNLEYRATRYHYLLVARAAGKERILGNGAITLAQDGSRSITRTVSVPPQGRRVEIRVSLRYSAVPFGHDTPSPETQAIHYWVTLTT